MKCLHQHVHTCSVTEQPVLQRHLPEEPSTTPRSGSGEQEEGGMVMDCGCGHPECEGSPASAL